MNEELTVTLTDGYGYRMPSQLKAAELFLSFYKEFGDEHYRYGAERLMERVAKDMNVDASSRAIKHQGIG